MRASVVHPVKRCYADLDVIQVYNHPAPKSSSAGGLVVKIEIKRIGNSDGLILPRELMQRLDLKRGQQLHVIELAGGGFQVLPYDPDFEKTMETADQIMDEYKDTLAALAK
jgi:putative addiction module antidote